MWSNKYNANKHCIIFQDVHVHAARFVSVLVPILPWRGPTFLCHMISHVTEQAHVMAEPEGSITPELCFSISNLGYIYGLLSQLCWVSYGLIPSYINILCIKQIASDILMAKYEVQPSKQALQNSHVYFISAAIFLTVAQLVEVRSMPVWLWQENKQTVYIWFHTPIFWLLSCSLIKLLIHKCDNKTSFWSRQVQVELVVRFFQLKMFGGSRSFCHGLVGKWNS